MNHIAFTLLALLFALGPAIAVDERTVDAAGEAHQTRPVLPHVTFWGDDSSIAEARFVRITTPKQWRVLYMEHKGLEPEPENPDWVRRHYNSDGVPDVNFERCMVIAVFKGDRANNAGVTVEEIEESDDRLLIRYRDHFFQTEGGFQEVRPYGIFILPRSEKPIVMEEMIQNMSGDPPTWKEVKRFAAGD